MKRIYYSWSELCKCLKLNANKILDKFNCNGNIVTFEEYCQLIKDSSPYDNSDFFEFIKEPNKDPIMLVIEYRPSTKDFEILVAAETSHGAGCCSLFISKNPTTKQYIDVINKLTPIKLRNTFY